MIFNKQTVNLKNMKQYTIAIIAATLLTACGTKEKEADAFGNFEAREVTVSAETSGRITSFGVDEGNVVEKGAVIATIDTTFLLLQKAEAEAAINSVRTKIQSINAQNEILVQQISNLDVNISRIGNMLQEEAATKKQLDDLTGQRAVLEKQIAAANTQKSSVMAEISVLEAKKSLLNEQIARSYVRTPIAGTITEKYAEEGELTAAGKPLVKIAYMPEIDLKVYVSGAMLERVKTGNECIVRIDNSEGGLTELKGTVSHIAEKAGFTPKIIQTKEERVTLVYEVTIRVANDGRLKSGMPGETIF